MTFTVCVLTASQLVAGEMVLPFKGNWYVMQGGDTLNVNHHMALRPQWYGLDFMKVDGPSGRELFKDSGQSLTDYYSWGAEVLSPIGGKVIHVVDGLPDNPIGTKDPENPAGNYVVIQTSEKKYVFIGHLKKGTVKVQKGMQVKPGEFLGLCGNSGNSDSPHIHIHMQDKRRLNSGKGLTMLFDGINVALSGKTFKDVNWPLIRGLFVSNTGSAVSLPTPE